MPENYQQLRERYLDIQDQLTEAHIARNPNYGDLLEQHKEMRKEIRKMQEERRVEREKYDFNKNT